MAGDRDWEKELAKVDKQLASLSDEALLGPAAVALLLSPRRWGALPAWQQVITIGVAVRTAGSLPRG